MHSIKTNSGKCLFQNLFILKLKIQIQFFVFVYSIIKKLSKSSKFNENKIDRLNLKFKKMYKKDENVNDEKYDGLPVSTLNQHISQLARTLYSSEKKKEIEEKKFHFPNLDPSKFKQKANHFALMDEVYVTTKLI